LAPFCVTAEGLTADDGRDGAGLAFRDFEILRNRYRLGGIPNFVPVESYSKEGLIVIDNGDSSEKERPVIRFPHVLRMDKLSKSGTGFESTARQSSFTKLGPTWPEELSSLLTGVWDHHRQFWTKASDLYYCCTTASSFCSLTWKCTGIIRQI